MNLAMDTAAFYTYDGQELICYERTERFAFLCPCRLQEDGSLTLDVEKTSVYPVECLADNMFSELTSLTIPADEIQRAKEA